MLGWMAPSRHRCAKLAAFRSPHGSHPRCNLRPIGLDLAKHVFQVHGVDAAAICEAVSRPSMRFVPVKSEAQQAALMLHRARDLLLRQRTQLINAVRGHLAEFGIIEAQGAWNLPRVLAHLETEGELPEVARQILRLLAAQLDEAEQRIKDLDAQIAAWHKASPASQRLATIPGIGPLVATAITATIADPSTFRSGREFAAWLGLV